MPFAWTAVYLMNVITSANSLDQEKEQQRSDSLGKLVVVVVGLALCQSATTSEIVKVLLATSSSHVRRAIASTFTFTFYL